MKRIFVMFLFLVPVCAFGDVNTKLVRTGETIAIPYKLSIQEVEAAILDGSVRRGWEPKKLSDGTIEDTLHIRSHVAVVHVVYTTESFRIDYADSTNLLATKRSADSYSSPASAYSITAQINSMKPSEQADSAMIHKNYYVWTQNLSSFILDSLATAHKAAESSSSAVSSVPNKLRELESLRKEGVITNEEYQKKKQQLLEKF